MKQIILDTNILLRFLLRDIENQYQIAEKLFFKAKSENITLIVPQIVIFEIVFNLDKFYKFDKKTIIEKIKGLLSVGSLEIQDREVFILAISIFAQSSLDLVDCFIIAKAELLQADIFTFDKNLNKLGGKQK